MKPDKGTMEPRIHAGFAIRAAAFLLDLLLINLFLLPVRLLFGIFRLMMGDTFLMAPILFQHDILDIMGYLLMVTYFVVTTYLTGQTLGKKVFEICVVSNKEETLTFFNVIYRETVGRFLSSLLLIGYFLILVEEDKQSLHDHLCDTKVVYRYRNAGKSPEAEPMAPVAEAEVDEVSPVARAEAEEVLLMMNTAETDMPTVMETETDENTMILEDGPDIEPVPEDVIQIKNSEELQHGETTETK